MGGIAREVKDTPGDKDYHARIVFAFVAQIIP